MTMRIFNKFIILVLLILLKFSKQQSCGSPGKLLIHDKKYLIELILSL